MQNTPNITPTPAPAPNPSSMPSSSESPQRGRFDGAKSVLSTLGIFLLAPLIALLLTAFVFQSYEVEGQSMERTLQDRDRLIVYKLPKTWSRIRNQHYQPARGDIVIFTKESAFPAGSNERQLIKRVVGVPGDHVVVQNNEVTVYNAENPTGFNPDKNQSFSEDLPPTTSGNIDMTVEEGQVFVLGDNRSNSQDSRVFGPIDTDTISGTLLLRIFPFNNFDSY